MAPKISQSTKPSKCVTEQNPHKGPSQNVPQNVPQYKTPQNGTLSKNHKISHAISSISKCPRE